METLLSIIIPAYNIQEYIGRCLDSLINQTYSNIEIIVVDDGSIDNTGFILDEYAKKDTRIKVVHKNNEGVSIARLTGMKIAQGDFIGFVDGDDIVELDMFELLLNNAINYNADISHSGYIMEFSDGRKENYYGTGKIVIQNNKSGLADLLTGEFVEPGLWNKIYKKDLIEKYIHNESMNYSIKNLEDLLMNYYLFKESSKSIYEDICKYHYMIRSNSASTTINRNKVGDPKKVLKIIFDDISDEDLKRIAYYRYIYTLVYSATQNNFIDIKKESKKELKKQISNFKNYNLNKKLKYMSIGVVYLYPVYMIVRKIYDNVTAVNKKI